MAKRDEAEGYVNARGYRMLASGPFAVRRWCERWQRGDGECFEVYDTRNGKCVSFPGFKYQMEKHATYLNVEFREGKVN